MNHERPVTCALPRNCKNTFQTLPYETSSKPDDEVVVRGVVTLPSLRRIVTKILSSNKLQICVSSATELLYSYIKEP